MYLYLRVESRNNKIDLKFCLTMGIKINCKEVTLKTKHEAIRGKKDKHRHFQ